MKSHTHQIKLKETILLSLLGVLMYVSQVIMASLPNIEIVSLLIILITRKFKLKALMSVYIFALCEILTYGIGIWSFNYLYVWTILWLIVFLVRKIDSVIVYTLISAIFGLVFDVFCSVPYFLTGGISGGISYIVAGIGFSLLHCAGNFIITLLLYRPLTIVFDRTVKTP